MKQLLLLVTLNIVMTGQSFAEEIMKKTKQDDSKWMERRDQRVKFIKERIQIMTSNKECMQNAKSKESFHECVKTIKAQREEFKKNMQNHKHGHKEKV